VIENKWPGFEKAFAGFKPGPMSLQPDEFWDDLMKDTRIARNGAKIMSVRANASSCGTSPGSMAVSANFSRTGPHPTRPGCWNCWPSGAAGSAAIPGR
jgi:methyladenine glycosylase